MLDVNSMVVMMVMSKMVVFDGIFMMTMIFIMLTMSGMISSCTLMVDVR